ncbi:MAG: hypothetical protein ABF325_11470 [Lentimonas sp.]
MFLAQMPTQQMPPLPEGPSLDRVRGPVDIPLFETWQVTTAATIVILICAILLWYFIRLLRKTSGRKKPFSAKAVARAELDAAASSADDDERFAVLISGALRTYFENGLRIPSNGRTSEEFLRSLKGNTQLNTSFNESLERFFAQCDAMKFARKTSNSEERTALTATAKELIQTAEKTKEETQS